MPRPCSGRAHAHAETKRPHLIDAPEHAPQLAQDPVDASVVGGVETFEFCAVVVSRCATSRAEVDVVGDSEVLERHERAPTMASQSRSSAAIRPPKNSRPGRRCHRCARGRGEAEQLFGFEVIEQPAVARAAAWVELVDDDHIELVRIDGGEW